MIRIVFFPEFRKNVFEVCSDLIKNSHINKNEERQFQNNIYEIYGKALDNDSVHHINYLKLNKQTLEDSSNQNLLIIGKARFDIDYKSKTISNIAISIDNKIIFNLTLEEISVNKKRYSKYIENTSNIYINRSIENRCLLENTKKISHDLNFDTMLPTTSETKSELREIEIINVDYSNLFIRIADSNFPLAILNNKKVAIIGLGSGGGLIASYLSKSGIHKFVLIDHDQFEVQNICRGLGSLDDIGRNKTLALKDYLIKRIPDLEITTLEEKFNMNTKQQEEKYCDLFKDVDLIISATGEHIVNQRVNNFAYNNNLPVVYAGTFEKISGGIMIMVNPHYNDTCYSCIYSSDKNKSNKTNNASIEEIPLIKPVEESIAYDRNMDDILSQPGLGIDIDNITIFVVKFILDKLLTQQNKPQVDTGVYHFDNDIYLWYNRDKNMRDGKIREALELYYFNNEEKKNLRNKDCSVCNILKNNQLQ